MTGVKLTCIIVEVSEATQNEKKYTCKFCTKQFEYCDEYYRHITRNHVLLPKMGRYPCRYCRAVFRKESWLLSHLITTHQRKSPHKCDCCDLKFKTRGCLVQHKKLKQLLCNPCYVCHKMYKSKEELDRHNEKKHTFAHKTYQCDYCQLCYKNKESIKVHIKRLHNEASVANVAK